MAMSRTSRRQQPDAAYLAVFRIAGIPDSIWFGRPWSQTAKNLFDALLYSLLTGGAFGWLY